MCVRGICFDFFAPSEYLRRIFTKNCNTGIPRRCTSWRPRVTEQCSRPVFPVGLGAQILSHCARVAGVAPGDRPRVFFHRHCTFNVYRSKTSLNHVCGMCWRGMIAEDMHMFHYLPELHETPAYGGKISVLCHHNSSRVGVGVFLCAYIIHACRRPAFRSKATIT